MRVGIISDLHVDTNRKKLKKGDTFVGLLNKVMMEKKVEVLLLAGDISSTTSESHKFLDELSKRSHAEILFVPGNHDLWDRDNESPRTLDIYQSFYDRKESIIGNPRIINEDWAVVGSPGWYDYEFADETLYSEEELAEGKLRFATWQDKKFIDWQQPDRVVSQEFLDQLKEDVEQVSDFNIILMTHIATHPDFVVALPDRLYDYMNAYLGARSYGVLFEHQAVKVNVMGHVHWRQRRIDNGVQHIMSCLGKYRYWLNPDDPEAELQNTLKVLTL